MLKQNHRAWVEVDHSAIKHNVHQLKSLLTSPTELMAIVKANAYGEHLTLALSINTYNKNSAFQA